MLDILETVFEGRKLSLKLGDLGMLSNTSIIVSYGDTCVLVNVNASEKPREGIDFFRPAFPQSLNSAIQDPNCAQFQNQLLSFQLP